MRWPVTLVLIGLLAAPAWGQTPPAASPQPAPSPPAGQSPTAPYSAVPYHPITPYPSSQYPSSRYPTSQYPTSQYLSSPATASGQPLTPAEAAAQRQSGLNETDVQALLHGQGYTKLNGIQADPGSIWVWQADAVKDGRPVRVGVDYRGNILVIAPEANRPCTAPGLDFGAGGPGAGARLLAARSCRQ